MCIHEGQRLDECSHLSYNQKHSLGSCRELCYYNFVLTCELENVESVKSLHHPVSITFSYDFPPTKDTEQHIRWFRLTHPQPLLDYFLKPWQTFQSIFETLSDSRKWSKTLCPARCSVSLPVLIYFKRMNKHKESCFLKKILFKVERNFFSQNVLLKLSI